MKETRFIKRFNEWQFIEGEKDIDRKGNAIFRFGCGNSLPYDKTFDDLPEKARERFVKSWNTGQKSLHYAEIRFRCLKKGMTNDEADTACRRNRYHAKTYEEILAIVRKEENNE